MKRLALTAFAMLVLASGAASAQQAQQSREAESLAREGQGLLDEGNVPAACAKLAASARLQPKVVATRMMLAVCFERLNRTATAHAEYQVVAKLAAGDDREWQREMMAVERMRALEKKLVRLTITAPNLVPGMEIRRNGVLVLAAQLGVAVPVDPGDVTVTATATGYEPFTTTVKIAKEKLTSVQVPALKKAETPPPPPSPSPGV
jgi:hypothetical protein